ncbi:MAG: preprotein translocase subunit YajC [Gammaproteobacteria bacterium]|nr:preprotein translocase subunit YajC [Gammaproteobacteria bacterium]
MDFLIDTASAQAGGAPAGGGLMSFLPLILLFVVFYFILIRPQMKRAKEHRKMVAELAVGDEVLTNGGLLGVVRQVGDTFLDVELGAAMTVKLHKHQVASVLPKGTWKAASKQSGATGKQSGAKGGKNKGRQTGGKSTDNDAANSTDNSASDDDSR